MLGPLKVLVTASETSSMTVVWSVLELLAVEGSKSGLLTDAVLTRSPESIVEATVYVAVTVAVPPEAILPRSQVKSAGSDSVSQDPWDGVTVPRVKAVGQVSVRLTAVAFDGPAFEIVAVYV